MTEEFVALDCTAQAQLVRDGKVSVEELVEAAIGRIEKLNPGLNAVITQLFEKARTQVRSSFAPRGPFHGVPLLLKDFTCQSAGDPYYAGMNFLKRMEWVEPEDSYLAARFRGAGFVVLGRTNTPELALMATTEPAAFGPTRNPWNLGYSPGGSSGGSAAAVAAGLVPAAHGNDAAGSLRIPASACGLVGLKPTRGRVSAGPGPESLGGLAVDGVLTRSVRDTGAILDAISGPMTGDPWPASPPARLFLDEARGQAGRLRIGVLLQAAEPPVHPDCTRATAEAARLLQSLGHLVEEDFPEAFFDPELFASFRIRSGASIAAQLDFWSKRTGQTIGAEDVMPETWFVSLAGRSTSAPQLATALARLQIIARSITAWWESGFDLLLTPTICEPPPRIGDFHDPENPLAALERSGRMIAFTLPFNITGQPAINIPFAWNDTGLPIGVQLVAAFGREDLLLGVASQLEQTRPWAVRTPPLERLLAGVADVAGSPTPGS